MNVTPDGARAGLGGRAILDSHVHFWDPRNLTYPWLEDVAPLNRPFTAGDFPQGRPEPVEVIFVEAGRAAREAAAEIEWVRRAARARPWIRGVVAHADLEDPGRAREVIRAYTGDPFVVGVRRNVQDEAAGFTATADFRAGVRLLGAAGLPFDACVRAHQLPELTELAAACPQTTIVLDHLGKPVPPGDTAWRQAFRRLAECANVVCKLSGLATEAGPGTERPHLLATLREALEIFGPERCLYGSDRPVMTLATDYESWLDLVRAALAGHPPAAVEAVLYDTAARIYRVRRRPATTRKDPQ
ncbi:amidohydrolase family protein [Actinoallomurus spadix]|uniref:Amidohydrolase family protein n=1 Tax=Actinoallomurus spadix TaxID=79912 RepID=A0ABP3GYJ5_9ACTN|nr:amidohydrolase family protein [Actinoallomurus spadix]MCO5984487.1 amidohydrolase family protein [Actinoallomurus spadix]